MKIFKLSKATIIIPIILLIISLYLLMGIEFVKTLPETCGIDLVIHTHFNCTTATTLKQISKYLLPISIAYLLILIILRLKNKT